MSGDEHIDFAWSTHRSLDEGRGDLCWSPVSVASALGLAAAGATGATRRELLKLLADGTDSRLIRHADRLSRAAEIDNAAATMTVANTLWIRDDLPIKDDYHAELIGWPGGSARRAPFRTDAEAARREINADVAKTTRDLITELLSPGAVTPETAAALVNALYLKTAWRHPFSRTDTESRLFHTPDGPVKVPMMRVTETLAHARLAGWQVLRLPAEGGVIATILLPAADLVSAERALTSADLTELLAAPQTARVALALPRLRLTARYDLRRTLTDLGVRTLFTDRAELSRITSEPLAVSQVVHESVLRVDEEGLEGAAATAMMMRIAMAVSDDPVRVVVDRPFLLVIQHAGSGAVYFLARVLNPT